ncbi:MAG: helix-turn-helix domain-containing protein [Pseudonocardiaceae bacterium]
MVEDTSHVGATIGMLRKAAGLTQAQLATRANVSVSLLSKVECADRVATHALLTAVARALKVPVERLTGQPYADNHRDEQTHHAIDALRDVLRRYDLPADQPARPVTELTAEVENISRLRRNANYRKLAARLPGLIEELTVAAHQANPATARRVYELLVHVYHAAHTLLHRLGYADLAESVEHKLAQAAEHSDDPLAGGLAQWARAQTFQSAGDYSHGLRLMDTARAGLEDQLHSPTPPALIVIGSLHLRSVTLASRAGDSQATREHLIAARELTARLGTGDQLHYGLTFGPANVTTHEVAANVELGDGAAALVAAEGWSPPSDMPRTRCGHHYLDLARACLIHGDRDGSLRALQQARQIAPQQTRLHPMVRDTAAVLVSLHRRANPELTSFANWLGLVS